MHSIPLDIILWMTRLGSSTQVVYAGRPTDRGLARIREVDPVKAHTVTLRMTYLSHLVQSLQKFKTARYSKRI